MPTSQCNNVHNYLYLFTPIIIPLPQPHFFSKALESPLTKISYSYPILAKTTLSPYLTQVFSILHKLSPWYWNLQWPNPLSFPLAYLTMQLLQCTQLYILIYSSSCTTTSTIFFSKALKSPLIIISCSYPILAKTTLSPYLTQVFSILHKLSPWYWNLQWPNPLSFPLAYLTMQLLPCTQLLFTPVVVPLPKPYFFQRHLRIPL